MAETLAEARDDLLLWAKIYGNTRQQYAEQKALAHDLRRLTDDEEALVPGRAEAQKRTFATMRKPLNDTLRAILREFNTFTGLSGYPDRTTAMRRLYQYMEDNSIEIKKRTVGFSAAVGGSNVGDSAFRYATTDRFGNALETSLIDTFTWVAQNSAPNLAGIGRENWTCFGTGRGAYPELEADGTGVTAQTGIPVAPGIAPLVKNASFDQAFNGTGTDKIPGWDIISGETNIARNTTEVAIDRGATNAASLEITGNCKLRFNFRKHAKTLLQTVPYVMGILWKADAAAGTLTLRWGTVGGSVYTVAVATSNSGFNVLLATDAEWLDQVNSDGEPVLEIEVSAYASGSIYLDDIIFDSIPYVGGTPQAIVSGVTPTVKDDSHTLVTSLDVGTGSVQLTGGASGSVDSVTVDGVELLSQAVNFNTSLNQTASDLADEINDNITNPNYEAEAVTDTVTISQIVPVEGTLTVTSTATTITTSDTDVTGATFGTTQDALVRKTGEQLRAAASATSGWEDEAL